MSVNVSEVENDYQLGMHPTNEINRPNEVSITQGNEAQHLATTDIRQRENMFDIDEDYQLSSKTRIVPPK